MIPWRKLRSPRVTRVLLPIMLALAGALAAIGYLGLPGARAVVLAATAGPVATATVEASSTPSATHTVEPSDTPTATPHPTATVTATAAPTATATPVPVLSLETYGRLLLPLVFAPVGMAQAEPTATPSPTATPMPTPTATPTPTPGPTPDGEPREVVVPILMYHHVAEPLAEWSYLRRSLTVSPESFRQQLSYLRNNGYETVSLDDLVDFLATGRPLPAKPVVITFDDGYRDSYEVAFPILQEFGYRATFFLVTAPIDQGSGEFMTWEQVREMHEAGMAFGAHSYTHPDLSGQSVEYLVWQIVGSKEAIEARTGEPVRYFAYPSSSYDDQAIAVLKSAGFWAALTTEPGCLHHPDDVWTLARVRVEAHDSVDKLANNLAFCAY